MKVLKNPCQLMGRTKTPKRNTPKKESLKSAAERVKAKGKGGGAWKTDSRGNRQKFGDLILCSDSLLGMPRITHASGGSSLLEKGDH